MPCAGTVLCVSSHEISDMEAGISIKELVEQTLNHVAKVEEPLLIYPEGAPDAVTIIDRDVLSLQPLHFPSANTVNFGNKYLLKESPRSSMRERFHILDSSFYSKLVGTGGASDGIEYEEARTWTGEVDLFEKDYIFIPIHEGMDWSLVVIRHLSNLRISSGDKLKGLPRIIHIDSDRGRHQNLGIESRLRRYILHAWNDRYQNTSKLDQLCLITQFILSDMKHIYTKVPQDNEYDSAIYLFHYIELLLELGSSDVVASSPEEPDFTMWDSSDVLAKRNQIRGLILKLSGKSQLELTLRLNYQEILSWLRDGAIADRRIEGLHYKDSISCAQGPEIMERGDYETVLENKVDFLLEEKLLERKKLDIELERLKSRGRKRGAIPRKEIEGEGKRSRSNAWSEDESLFLLRYITDENRFRKGKVMDWRLVSSEMPGRTGIQCQQRWDTLRKAFNSVKRFCIDTGKAISELTDDDLGKLHVARGISVTSCRLLDTYLSRKELTKRPILIKDGENGNGSNELHRNSGNYSLSSSLSNPSPQVSTESSHGRLLADSLSGNAQEHAEGLMAGILSPNCSDDPVSHLPSLLTERDTSRLKTVSTSSTAEGGVYRRQIISRHGSDNSKYATRIKYEPRFKPPRDQDSRPYGSLYLGQYDTYEDAKIVRQIAAFYYGRDNDRLHLGDGVHFTIPPMGEGEVLLSGKEKRAWVSRKARSIYLEAVEEKRKLQEYRVTEVYARDIDQTALDLSRRLSDNFNRNRELDILDSQFFMI